jgi:hypothetical protein
MDDADLIAGFDRLMDVLKTLGLVLGFILAAVLGVGGLVVAAHIGGLWGVFLFAIYVGCMMFGVTDAYAASRLRRQRRIRVAPPLR